MAICVSSKAQVQYASKVTLNSSGMASICNALSLTSTPSVFHSPGRRQPNGDRWFWRDRTLLSPPGPTAMFAQSRRVTLFPIPVPAEEEGPVEAQA
jgi:hypothetical protein